MQDLIEKLQKQEEQLAEIHKTVRQLRRYFLTTIVLTLLTFLLPIIGIIISIPWLVKLKI